MARKKKQVVTIKDPETLAILGIICLVLSFLFIVSAFLDGNVFSYIRSLLGVGVPVMGIVLLLTGIRLLGTKRDYNNLNVILLLIIFLFSFLGWIHLFADVNSASQLANVGQYGGIVGFWISTKLKELSVEVAFMLLSFGMIFSLFGLLNLSPKKISEKIVIVIDFLIIFFRWLLQQIKTVFKLIVLVKQKLDNFTQKLLVQSQNKSLDNSVSQNQLKLPQDLKISTDNINSDTPKEQQAIKMVSDISKLKFIENLNNNHNNNQFNSPEKKNISPNLVNNSDFSTASKKNTEKEYLDLTVRNYPNWILPPLDLLDKLKPKQQDSKLVIERKAQAIIETLKSFNIEAKVLGYTIGPAVTQFFIDPAAGIKFSKIASLSKDLALTLASPADLRIELVPGKSYIGIDVPNDIRQTTQLIESIQPIIQNPKKYKLGLAVGIDNQGLPVCRDLASAPHLLIAGATGQGKSVLVNAFIISLLMQKSPDELKFIMIDPKMVEMAPYEGIPHLLTSPITDMSNASKALKWAVNEMEERYKILRDHRVRNIDDYLNQTGNLMPYIIIIIDEFSDLMMQYRQEVETSIIRLAQKSRAVGIHLVIATQRPTADVITGLIKSNIPTRIALAVASSTDSRVILDSTGAETLLGRGDLLIKMPNDLKPVRVQGLYIDDKGPDSEFYRILNFIKQQAPNVHYNEDAIFSSVDSNENIDLNQGFTSRDPLFKQAAEIIIAAQKGSASLLQTKMKIGYARAARLIDELEQAGIVGPQDGPRPREVLISDLDTFYAKINSELNSD